MLINFWFCSARRSLRCVVDNSMQLLVRVTINIITNVKKDNENRLNITVVG